MLTIMRMHATGKRKARFKGRKIFLSSDARLLLFATDRDGDGITFSGPTKHQMVVCVCMLISLPYVRTVYYERVLRFFTLT